jgi:hypothetical protein
MLNISQAGRSVKNLLTVFCPKLNPKLGVLTENSVDYLEAMRRF